MKVTLVNVLAVICLFVWQSYAEQPFFKTSSVTSSLDIYNLIENNQNNVFIFAFYTEPNSRDLVVEKVEDSLWFKPEIFDQVVYVTIKPKDDYQFEAILNDLGIINEPWENFPYFLVVKNGDGRLVSGSKADEAIKNIIISHLYYTRTFTDRKLSN